MNFDYTEEQQMVRDSIARFVQDDYDWDTRRAIVDSDKGMSRQNWQTFAELGWLSIPFSEADGGFGGNIVDMSVVMEEMGKGLVVEPFFPTVVLFGGVVARWRGKTGKAMQRTTLHYLPLDFRLALTSYRGPRLSPAGSATLAPTRRS